MTFMLVLLAWIGLGLLIELVAIVIAPVGYEDERGFHLGSKTTTETEETFTGNPS